MRLVVQNTLNEKLFSVNGNQQQLERLMDELLETDASKKISYIGNDIIVTVDDWAHDSN